MFFGRWCSQGAWEFRSSQDDVVQPADAGDRQMHDRTLRPRIYEHFHSEKRVLSLVLFEHSLYGVRRDQDGGQLQQEELLSSLHVSSHDATLTHTVQSEFETNRESLA